MHAEGEKFLGIPPEKTFPGQSLLPQAGRIKEMILRHGAKTLLDYGSGKGLQYRPMEVVLPGVGKWPSIQAFWGVDGIYCYDPCYEPFNKLPDKKFDGVISTDVLEHCPAEDIPWILDEMFGYADRFVFANVACYPAKKRLPNGENCHCTIREPEWWHKILLDVSSKYSGVKWEVWVQSQVETGGGKKFVEKRLGN
jgi:hypothetical protein